MRTPNIQTETRVSASAIVFATLIGIGFWITLAVLGGALATTYASKIHALPTGNHLVGGGILGVGILSLAFLIAGYIAAKISHQRFLFDSVIHSLSTWALMAILLLMLVSSMALIKGVSHSIHGLKAPSLVTEVEFFKGRAVTTIHGGGKSKKSKKSAAEDKEAEEVLKLALWICCSSLMVGAATSVIGGLLGRGSTVTSAKE